MYTEEDKIKIADLLRPCQQFMKPRKLKTIPGNYAQLKEAALLEELCREVQKLTALFSSDAANEALLKQAFVKLCAEREEQNQGTCMSYTALPEGMCNSLYLEIATVLFKPRDFGELAAVLLPGMKASLTAELVFSQTYTAGAASLKAEENLDVTLKEEPLAVFAAYPAQRSMLTQIVTGDNLAFNLESIANLPLRLREQFHRLIVKYPALRNKIYKHNDDLQQLLFDLELLTKHGSTPDEMLQHLSDELLRAGTRFTGNVHAASSVTGPCSQFRHYLDQLPSGLEEKLVAMRSTDGEDSLAKVLEHLANANCVEQTAEQIRKIRENPANKVLLMSHPGTTKEQESKIKQKYAKAIEVIGFESTNKLPEKLLQELIRNISIKSAHDYIDLLLNLPAEEYLAFLTYASITCTPPLPAEMASAINMLNTVQATAFFEALFALKDKFGGLSTIVFLAVRCNQITGKAFQAVPERELYALIKTTEKENNTTLLSLAARDSNPEIWQLLWGQLSTEDRLELLNKGDKFHLKPLHNAARNNNPEILRTLLEFLPEQKRLTYLKDKDVFFRVIPLDLAIRNRNPVILRTIRQCLPTKDYLEAIIDKALSLLAKVVDSGNTENLRSLIADLKQHKLTHVLSEKSYEKRNILHTAALQENTEILRILLGALNGQEIKTLLSEKDNYNNTPLRSTSHRIPAYCMMMGHLTEDERFADLHNSNQISVLARAAHGDWSKTWSLFEDKNKFASLFLDYVDGWCPLYDVARNKDPEMWHDVWGALRPEQRSAFVKGEVNNKSVLHYLAGEGHFKAWSDVWEVHSADEQSAGFVEKAANGETILHCAVRNQDRDVTRTILQFLSVNNLLTALNTKREGGDTPLHLASAHHNSSFLFALLELMPAKDRLTALTQRNREGHSVLHMAADEADCWRVFWQLLPAEDRPYALREKNTNGSTPLHIAIYGRSELISIMLSPLSQQERMLVLSEQNSQNHTPIYMALLNATQNWKSVWNYMPEPLRLSEIKDKKYCTTLLHLAASKNQPELVVEILKLLPVKDRLAALTEVDENGYTPLQIAAGHDNEMLLSMLEYLPQQDHLTAIRKKNTYGDTVLHVVARSSKANLYALLQALPGGDRLTVLLDINNSGLNPLNGGTNETNLQNLINIRELFHLHEILLLLKTNDKQGNTLVHAASVYPEIFLKILNMLPEDGRLLMLNQKNELDNTPLHYIARNWSVGNWSELWKLFTDKGKFASLFAEQKNKEDVCPLHRAAQNGNPEIWHNLWGALNENQKTAFARNKTREGTGLLHIAAQSGCLEVWRAVWAFHSEQERLSAFTEKSGNGSNILHWLTDNHDVRVSRDIVQFLSEKELSAMLAEKDSDGKTSLDLAVAKRNTKVLLVLLVFIVKNVDCANIDLFKNSLLSLSLISERLNLLAEKDNFGNNLLHYAVYCATTEIWAVTLQYLRPYCWQTLKLSNRFGNTPLHRAAERDNFAALVEFIPAEERLALVMQMNHYGDTPLHVAVRNNHIPQLRSVLQSLPQPERLQALKAKSRAGSTLLHCLSETTNEENIVAIVDILSREERLLLVTEKNKFGQTPLDRAAKNKNFKVWSRLWGLLSQDEKDIVRENLNRPKCTLFQVPPGSTAVPTEPPVLGK